MPKSKIRNRCCQQCGISYTLGTESTQHKYCSVKCRNTWQNKHAGKRYRNSEHGKRTMKGWRLSREFGISHEIYDRMLAKQNYSCAICLRTSPTGYGWHVDHCHTTKKLEGFYAVNVTRV